MPRSIKTTGAALLLLCLTLAAGCGGSSAPTTTTASGSTDLVMVDCSASFRRSALSFVSDMVAIAQASASERRSLWAGCVDGAPLRTLRWTIRVDFGELPASADNASGLAQRLNTARALGLRPRFVRLIRDTPVRVRGSGLLEALELAAQTPGVGRVFLFTDALTFEPDSVHLASASRSQLRTTARRWTRRLHGGLAGIDVLLIGVGRDARSSVAVRNGEWLFQAVVTGADGHFEWSQELPASFAGVSS